MKTKILIFILAVVFAGCSETALKGDDFPLDRSNVTPNLTNDGENLYPVWVNFTLENSGTWLFLEDGSKIWRLKVNIPNALATVTYYDKFWLPEGGKFFVYNEETKQSIGAVISDFIESSHEKPIEFATSLIYGENVVYEYHQPASVKEHPIISINRIEISNWQAEKNAIARISITFPDPGFCTINIL